MSKGDPGDASNAAASQVLQQQVTSPAAAGWATIATGWTHTSAIRGDGTLWCWGYNADGELGIGNTTYETELAQQVADCRPVRAENVVRAPDQQGCLPAVRS